MTGEKNQEKKSRERKENEIMDREKNKKHLIIYYKRASILIKNYRGWEGRSRCSA